MKYFITILILLVGIGAFSQTVYTLPYDSVKVKKPNGTGFLDAAKLRATDTAFLIKLRFQDGNQGASKVLTSDANGNAHWSTGGGGSAAGNYGSVQLNRNGVFSATDSIRYINGALTLNKKDSAGFRFNYSWATNPINTWTQNLTTTTATPNGTSTNFSGGGLNFNNNLSLNQWVGAEDFTLVDTIIAVNKSISTSGESIYFTAATGTGQSSLFTFLLADTAGYITYMPSKTLPTGTSINNKNQINFQWLAGDSLVRKIQRLRRTFIVSMTNKRTGMVSQLVVNNVFPTTGQPEIYFHGGSWTHVGRFTITYNAFSHVTVAGIGNSIEHGFVSTNYLSTWFQTATSGVVGGNCLMAGPTETSATGLLRVQDLPYVNPGILLYAYGVNDRNSSVPLATYSANVDSVIRYCIAHSIRIILVNLVPQSAGTVVPYNDTLTALAARYSLDPVVDIYTALKGAGTAMNSIYDYGDGTHPNQAGHTIIGQLVRKAITPYVTFNQSPLVPNLPISTNNRNPILVTDANNNIFQQPFVPDSAYVNIQGVLDNTSVPQTGGFFTTSGWVQNVFIVGGTTPNYLGGDFSVNKNNDSYTRATRFVSGPFYTDANGANIDGSISGVPKLNLLNGGNIQGGFMSALLPSGYSHPIDYSALGNNDWITKRLVDSLIATGGGSSLFPTSGTGTATGDVTADISTHLVAVNGTSGGFSAVMDDGTSQGFMGTGPAATNTSLGWLMDDNSAGGYIEFGSDINVTMFGTGTLKYNADYSANYTSRSLVDKAYVDAHSGGITGLTAARIPVAASATSLTDYEGLKWSSTNNEVMISRATSGHGLNIRGEIPRILMKDTTATNSIQLTFEDNGGNQAFINSNGVNIHFGLAGRNPLMKLYQSTNSVVIANDATAVSPDASAQLQVESTSKGFLPPRMTAAQASAISSPAQWLIIGVTTTNGTFTSPGIWTYTGSVWQQL